ncbi:Hypothetical protein Minf_0362 [Methylacidiphilum infernorum V4]|uniref:Uncharacterized protein n=1 Tax=Methylacidiphilum infernorum (isolate V4) TaxID=481448 RepID=B3DYP8_METI4|nr:Hypothetical protein Minf_0362 [Methylacidiphilum infernorum V4]
MVRMPFWIFFIEVFLVLLFHLKKRVIPCLILERKAWMDSDRLFS